MSDLPIILDCAHCGAAIECEVEPFEWDDEEPVLLEDAEYICERCHGANHVKIDGEIDCLDDRDWVWAAYFRACDDPDCPACALADAEEGGA